MLHHSSKFLKCSVVLTVLQHGSSQVLNFNLIICIIGVCTDTYVSYQSVLEKRPMNRKFDHCVSQKDVTS